MRLDANEMATSGFKTILPGVNCLVKQTLVIFATPGPNVAPNKARCCSGFIFLILRCVRMFWDLIRVVICERFKPGCLLPVSFSRVFVVLYLHGVWVFLPPPPPPHRLPACIRHLSLLQLLCRLVTTPASRSVLTVTLTVNLGPLDDAHWKVCSLSEYLINK